MALLGSPISSWDVKACSTRMCVRGGISIGSDQAPVPQACQMRAVFLPATKTTCLCPCLTDYCGHYVHGCPEWLVGSASEEGDQGNTEVVYHTCGNPWWLQTADDADSTPHWQGVSHWQGLVTCKVPRPRPHVTVCQGYIAGVIEKKPPSPGFTVYPSRTTRRSATRVTRFGATWGVFQVACFSVDAMTRWFQSLSCLLYYSICNVYSITIYSNCFLIRHTIIR